MPLEFRKNQWDAHSIETMIHTIETRRRVATTLLIAAIFTQGIALIGCKSAAKPEPKPRPVGWRHIGDWSGRGSTQTESFNIEGTLWRIRWETKGEETPGTGTFVVMVHSAVSGRPIALGVEHNGNGKDTAYVSEDPRLYHLVIESSGVDWSFTVEEAVVGDAPSGP